MPSRVIPALRYHDGARAVSWLVEAFGFTPQLVVDGEGATIDHAQLAMGDGMVMVGSVQASEYGDLVTTAPQAGKPTAGIYVIVDDVDDHAATAAAAGAEIVTAPVDEEYGGRSYACRDFEGNVWIFGSYDPWAT